MHYWINVRYNSELKKIYVVIMCWQKHMSANRETCTETDCFLPRDAYAQRGLCRGKMSVRLSVRHTQVLSLNGYRYPQSFFHHRVAHHSSFPIPNGMSIFRREPPNGGIEIKGGMKKITIFDQYRALPRNWCKTDPELLWKANRKPHPNFRIVPMTLRDL